MGCGGGGGGGGGGLVVAGELVFWIWFWMWCSGSGYWFGGGSWFCSWEAWSARRCCWRWVLLVVAVALVLVVGKLGDWMIEWLDGSG